MSRADLVHLTPATLRRVDTLAKRLAGCAIQVLLADEIDGNWGVFSWMADTVCLNTRGLVRDGGPHNFRETAWIGLAPSVDYARFRECSRPELDWSHVPRERVYDFIVLHEIGHCVDNFEPFDLAKKQAALPDGDRRLWGRHFTLVNEVLADRFAWCALFPGTPLPIDPRRTLAPIGISTWLATFGGTLRRGMGAGRKPMPTAAHLCVPTQHLKHGIPWAPEVARRIERRKPRWLVDLDFARSDYRARQLRWKKRATLELQRIGSCVSGAAPCGPSDASAPIPRTSPPVKVHRRAYRVGHDVIDADGTRLWGAPLGPYRMTRLQARKLLRRVLPRHPGAYIERTQRFR